jgi:hypothetical protein
MLEKDIGYSDDLKAYLKQRKELFDQALGMISDPFTVANFIDLVRDLANKKGIRLLTTPYSYEGRRTHGGFTCIEYDRVRYFLLRKVGTGSNHLSRKFRDNCWHFTFNR